MGDNSIPYLKLDPSIEQAILADRAAGRKNPYAFDDADVLRREANPHDDATITRPAFARDIEKIINIPAYNRYADKTQVFSFVENDDICRRGLHVQLVSRISRGIGDLLGLNVQLIEAIALGHDLGHTPFGHAGERYLSEIFEQHTGLTFRHNVHSVRVMDQLYRRNISLQTLDGALCHNGEFAQQVLKLGDLRTFEQLDDAVVGDQLHIAQDADHKQRKPRQTADDVEQPADQRYAREYAKQRPHQHDGEQQQKPLVGAVFAQLRIPAKDQRHEKHDIAKPRVHAVFLKILRGKLAIH